MTTTLRGLLAVVFAAFMVAGCGTTEPEPVMPPPEDTPFEMEPDIPDEEPVFVEPEPMDQDASGNPLDEFGNPEGGIRELRRRIKKAFDAERVEIPFPHVSVYFGKASKPVSSPAGGLGGEARLRICSCTDAGGHRGSEAEFPLSRMLPPAGYFELDAVFGQAYPNRAFPRDRTASRIWVDASPVARRH